MSRTDLQAILDRSLAGASDLTRALFVADSWNADRVEAFVNECLNIIVCTTLATGEAHAASAIAGCHDGHIYCTASIGSASLGNLRRTGALAFAVTDNKHSVVGRGDCVEVGRSGDLAGLIATLAEVVGGRFTPEGWDGYIFKIKPRTIFAN